MSKKTQENTAIETTGKHFRLSVELLQWLRSHARARGFNNDSELLREIIRDYRDHAERRASAA